MLADGRTHLMLVAPDVRRHHFRAVQSLDGRHRGPVHTGVLCSRAGAAGPRRRALPMGAHLRHPRRRSPIDRRHLRIGISRRRHVARRRRRPPSDRGDDAGCGSASQHRTSLAASRPCAADLATVGVRHVFGLLSLFLAGGPGLTEFRDRSHSKRRPAGAGVLGAAGDLRCTGQSECGDAAPARGQVAAAPVVASTVASATPAMWRNLGLMYLDAKAADLAYDALARAVESDPHDEAALAGLSRAAAATRRGETAGTLLAHLAQRDSREHARTDCVVTASCVGRQDRRRASGCRRGAPDRSVERRRARAAGINPRGRRRRGELERVVQAMTRDHPERPGTLYYRAVLHFLRGEFAEAAAAGERAAAADPTNARVQNLLGAAFGNLGQPDRARAALETAARTDPKGSIRADEPGDVRAGVRQCRGSRRTFFRGAPARPRLRPGARRPGGGTQSSGRNRAGGQAAAPLTRAG